MIHKHTFIALLALAPLSTAALHGQVPAVTDSGTTQKVFALLEQLVGQYDKCMEKKIDLAQIPSRLETVLSAHAGQIQNPWDSKISAIEPRMLVLPEMPTAESAFQGTCGLACIPGRAVFTIQLPSETRPGFLSVAYRPKEAVNGEKVLCKVIAIE